MFFWPVVFLRCLCTVFTPWKHQREREGVPVGSWALRHLPEAQGPCSWSWAGPESFLCQLCWFHGKLSLKLVLKHNLTLELPSHRKRKIFLAKRGSMGFFFLPFPEFKVTHLRPLVDFNDCWQVLWLFSGSISTELPGKGPAAICRVEREAVPGLRGHRELGHCSGVPRDWNSTAGCATSHRNLYSKNLFFLLAQPGLAVVPWDIFCVEKTLGSVKKAVEITEKM